jgi:hypothetical protein
MRGTYFDLAPTWYRMMNDRFRPLEWNSDTQSPIPGSNRSVNASNVDDSQALPMLHTCKTHTQRSGRRTWPRQCITETTRCSGAIEDQTEVTHRAEKSQPELRSPICGMKTSDADICLCLWDIMAPRPVDLSSWRQHHTRYCTTRTS